MSTIEGRTWLEILSPAVCWDLVAGAKVGRVGVVIDSGPEIYPVNHGVDDRTIVVRTDAGSKLRAIARVPLVCFQVDGVDAEQEAGWSVLVKGRGSEIVDPVEICRAEALRITPWAIGRKVHWIRIRPDEVTGRRIRPLRSEGGGRHDR
jgi:nitroimidazol reductase NimA-like FMN-containing flavoprotein (pyridoxamine 5'-phosphate oxidase superfamily)